MAENFKDFRNFQITVDIADGGERLDRWLSKMLADFSRSRIKDLIEQGYVQENSGVFNITPAFKVRPAQTFHIQIPQPTAALPIAQALPLDILYEDEDLLVINKQAGLTVHPAPGNPDHTLVNALLAHCGSSLSGIGGVKRPGIVHRLDKDTSGLMVIAKNDKTHQPLSQAFADRQIKREYLAVVWGIIQPTQGRIEGNIGRHPINRKKMAVVPKGGKNAATNYALIQPIRRVASLVKCRLETGRTHQIRVHLSHFGCPIVGDPVYTSLTAARKQQLSEATLDYFHRFSRQALHAFSLGFTHPQTNQYLYWERDLPADMITLIEYLQQFPTNQK